MLLRKGTIDLATPKRYEVGSRLKNSLPLLAQRAETGKREGRLPHAAFHSQSSALETIRPLKGRLFSAYAFPSAFILSILFAGSGHPHNFPSLLFLPTIKGREGVFVWQPNPNLPRRQSG